MKQCMHKLIYNNYLLWQKITINNPNTINIRVVKSWYKYIMEFHEVIEKKKKKKEKVLCMNEIESSPENFKLKLNSR